MSTYNYTYTVVYYSIPTVYYNIYIILLLLMYICLIAYITMLWLVVIYLYLYFDIHVLYTCIHYTWHDVCGHSRNHMHMLIKLYPYPTYVCKYTYKSSYVK